MTPAELMESIARGKREKELLDWMFSALPFGTQLNLAHLPKPVRTLTKAWSDLGAPFGERLLLRDTRYPEAQVYVVARCLHPAPGHR